MHRPLPNPSAKRSRAGSKRRAAGWMLLALSVVVTGACVASGWWYSAIYGNHDAITLVQGSLKVERFSSEMSPIYQGLRAGRYGNEGDVPKWRWWNQAPARRRGESEIVYLGIGVASYRKWEVKLGGDCAVGVALLVELLGEEPKETRAYIEVLLWPLPLLLWTTGGLALWSGRRARTMATTNHCPTCSYDLVGLPVHAVCPECGRRGSEKKTMTTRGTVKCALKKRRRAIVLAVFLAILFIGGLGWREHSVWHSGIASGTFAQVTSASTLFTVHADGSRSCDADIYLFSCYYGDFSSLKNGYHLDTVDAALLTQLMPSNDEVVAIFVRDHRIVGWAVITDGRDVLQRGWVSAARGATFVANP